MAGFTDTIEMVLSMQALADVRVLVRSVSFTRPAVLRRLHAIDARRLRENRRWVVSFSDFAAARALARGGRSCCLRSPRRVVRRREAFPLSKDEQYPQKLLVGFRLGLVTSGSLVS